MTDDPRLPNIYRVLDEIAAEIQSWDFMPEYSRLRLSDPQGSPAEQMAAAKKSVAGKAA